MKIEKLSLQGIKNVLSRRELKEIMAGSSPTNCGCTPAGTGLCCSCTEGTAPYYHMCPSGVIDGCGPFCFSMGFTEGNALQVDCNNCP